SVVRGLDRRYPVLDAGAGHARQHVLGGGIEHFQRGAVRGRAPLAADVQLLADFGNFRMHHDDLCVVRRASALTLSPQPRVKAPPRRAAGKAASADCTWASGTAGPEKERM